MEGLGKNEYEDVTQDIPTEDQWRESQDPTQSMTPQRRVHGKRPLQETRHEGDPSTGPKQRRGQSSSDGVQTSHENAAWWTMIPDEAFSQEEHTMWNKPDASLEISVNIPESKRGQRSMLDDMSSYFTSQMKRRAVEVTEKRLTPAERELFRVAKEKEVKNFLAANAFEAIPAELRPNKSQAIGMRWILTWKKQEDGSSKAKARAILKGFQDPEYEYRTTTTPVMTRQTRQLLLSVAAQRRWKVKKGDVSGAFLQGREYPGSLYCIPCPEILQAMGLSEEEVVKVKRGCYGLVDAPHEWYMSVSEYFQTLGLQKSWSDPCCWMLKINGVLRGLIAGHVDDFLFAGHPDDAEWSKIEVAIQKHYKWSEWQTGDFTQCGVRIQEMPDGAFHLSQPHYMDGVQEINLSATRRKDSGASTNEWEKSQLRAALGGLSWHAQQVSPHLSAEIGLLLSEIKCSTVSTIVKTNKLVYEARRRKEHKLIIHAHGAGEELALYTWVDAACQNRPSGDSTQGIFIGLAPKRLSEGTVEKINPVAWHASRIDRVVRSPGAAEAKALVSGEDYLFHARYQLGELLEETTDVFDVDRTANRVHGCLISDSRNVYDKLQTSELSTKGAERRTDIELLCIKSAQRYNNVEVRWVHSEAQLSNALTKGGAKELESFYQLGGMWRIVCDAQMRSAKKRRQDGIGPLTSTPA